MKIALQGSQELKGGTLKGTFIFSVEDEDEFHRIKKAARAGAQAMLGIERADVLPAKSVVLSEIAVRLGEITDFINREAGAIGDEQIYVINSGEFDHANPRI